MKYNIKLKGYELEIEQDEDGCFIIPDRFRGVGSGLKPAHEDYILASKGDTDLVVDSKFIYQAKPSGKEKNEGLDGFEDKAYKDNNNGARTYNSRCKNCGKKFIGPKDKICCCDNPQTDESVLKMKNNHPTIKSTKLMSYLIKMITPPNGIVLDPFMGSGSTGVAAVENGFHFIGIEMEPEYFEIAKARINFKNGK